MKRWTIITLTAVLGVSLILVDTSDSQAKSYRHTLKGKRAWIGIEAQSVDRELAEAFKLKSEYGVIVNEVNPDSPAEEAGLEDGDVIVRLNDERIVDLEDLNWTIRDMNAGDSIKLTIVRDGKEMTKNLELDRMPSNYRNQAYSYFFDGPDIVIPPIPPIPPVPPVPPIPAIPSYHGRSFSIHSDGSPLDMIGVEAIELTDGLREYLGVGKNSGIFVVEIEKRSAAEKAGIKVGDVITRADNKRVYSPEDLMETVWEFDDGDTVELAVIRDKKEMKLKLEVDEDMHGVRFFGRSGGHGRAAARGLSFGADNGAVIDLRDLAAQLKDLKVQMNQEMSDEDYRHLQMEMDKLRKELQELKEKLH